jgi:pyruvate dehydrogenase E2 component (dihydrolipoamide acetyltransferase)
MPALRAAPPDPPSIVVGAISTPAVAPARAAPIPLTPLAHLPPFEVESLGTFQDVANNNMRKVIACRITKSKQDVPHWYTSMEVELDNVLKLRKQLVTQGFGQ